jgi:hypothetical protein
LIKHNDGMVINTGDTILIKPNLSSVLEQLSFHQDAIDRTNSLVNTIHTVKAVWSDENGQRYATVMLCVEVPVECCELIKKD